MAKEEAPAAGIVKSEGFGLVRQGHDQGLRAVADALQGGRIEGAGLILKLVVKGMAA
ncbi:MAG: hypothetical protein BWY77_01860 [bacterium ADurb.Bin431]|nr:MAG: hypothetical protein BWY77_01860 [bacterium ADurb.Bin431]